MDDDENRFKVLVIFTDNTEMIIRNVKRVIASNESYLIDCDGVDTTPCKINRDTVKYIGDNTANMSFYKI